METVIGSSEGKAVSNPEDSSNFIVIFWWFHFGGFDADKLDGLHYDNIISAVLPVRSIIVWSNSEETIPDGWAACDGTTHEGIQSPDLRERFVIGAGGAYSVGQTAGPATWKGLITPTGAVTVGGHILTVDELPIHGHPFIEKSQAANLGYGNSGSGITSYQTSTTSILNQNEGTPGQPHGHPGSSISFTGIDPRPSWYALFYIIKYR